MSPLLRDTLGTSSGPYLRQHADNPVDWYPWGDRGLRGARGRGCPVLLSVGYSSCHWCHVMAHESFEDPDVAAVMNDRFVSVKVDREERPDVDAVYMQAVQALTGSGGWPMTVFLDPEGTPFFGGTYFPRGPPRAHRVPAPARAVDEAWQANRGDLVEQGAGLRALSPGPPPGAPGRRRAVRPRPSPRPARASPRVRPAVRRVRAGAQVPAVEHDRGAAPRRGA